MESKRREGAGKRFLKRCQEFLGITGFVQHDEAFDRLADQIIENPQLSFRQEISQELERLSGILESEHSMIAEAIREGRLLLEVEELILAGAAFSCVNPESLSAIKEAAENGRLSPEATASFRSQEKEFEMEWDGKMLQLTTEPAPSFDNYSLPEN